MGVFLCEWYQITQRTTNIKRLKASKYIKNYPLDMFDRVLNTPLVRDLKKTQHTKGIIFKINWAENLGRK